MLRSAKNVGILMYGPSSLKFHPSIVNSALLLAQEGYEVDIFKPYHPDEGAIPHELIRVVHACRYAGNPLLRLKSLVTFLKTVVRARRRYTTLICVDTYGLLLGACTQLWLESKLIYYSLEILTTKQNYITLQAKSFLTRNAYILHHSLFRFIEEKLIGRARLIIVQDEHRWSLLKQIAKINDSMPVAFVPNSPRKNGDSPAATDYLRRRFGIPKSSTVVLYAGSLGEWTGTDRIINAAAFWPDNLVLVLHGFGNPGFVNRLKEATIPFQGRVWLSLDQLDEKQYNQLLCSADVGLSWYADPQDPNVYNIGAASGKLFYYLMHGIPVVANRYPGLPEVLERSGAGICVEKESEIGQAVETIRPKIAFYREKARKAFRCYEFSHKFRPVIDFIEAL